jgi:glucokinase
VGGHVIGVDAGGTKLLVGVVGAQLQVDRRVRRLWHGGGQDEVLGAMTEAVEEALESAPDARAIGFGIPSLVDRANGVSLQSVHLPLDDVPFRDLMSERFDVPVYVDNDANLAALCEHRHGAARGATNAVLLTIGTGIGGALLALDGGE